MDKRNVDEMWGKAILRGKDVKEMLQELSDKIELMQEDHDDLVESYRKLKDEKFKDEEIKRLKEELDHYRYNSLIVLSDKQKGQVKEFKNKHHHDCKSNYVKYILSPTELGTGVDIICPVCGETLDITDYDLW